MKNKERRKETRINKKITFQFKIVPANLSKSEIMNGLLIDYSVAGIRFMADEQLDKNISLFIQLNPDDLSSDNMDWRNLWETGNETYLNVIGSVMWCLASEHEFGKFEIGTRFTQKTFEKLTSEASNKPVIIDGQR